MALSAGQVLENRYRIVSLLGQSGMGAVYHAWDLNLRVPVALKENLDLSLVSQQQFEREALLLAQLNHPNLPRVTNHFVIPGQAQYLVREFIEGQDLQQWLDQRGKLTEAEAVPVVPDRPGANRRRLWPVVAAVALLALAVAGFLLLWSLLDGADEAATPISDTAATVATAGPVDLPTRTAAPAGVIAATATGPTPSATATPGVAEYTVVASDTLGAIAARFGITVEELVTFNGLADPDQITAGVVLRLPGSETTPTPGDAATPSAETPSATALASATAATAAPATVAPLTFSAATPPIGQSYDGRPIEHYIFGAGPVHLAFVGAIHGGYEWNSANLAYAMIDYFERNPAAVPDAITLHIVPVANPDGLARVAPDWQTGPIPTPAGVISDTYSGRFNGRNVDLNRNWDCNWRPTGVWRDEIVDAGLTPFSEPEVVALRDFFLDIPMAAVVFWHSAAGTVLAGLCDEAHAPSRELAGVYAAASGYSTQAPLGYEINGDASDWLTTQAIPSIAVELTNHSAIEWDRNIAGTLAVLDHFAAICAAEGCGESDR